MVKISSGINAATKSQMKRFKHIKPTYPIGPTCYPEAADDILEPQARLTKNGKRRLLNDSETRTARTEYTEIEVCSEAFV